MSKHLLTYDYIITGFGCAGMSLVYHLLNSQLRDKKILIIDISDKKTNDRTWCYWAETPLDIHPKNSPLTFWKNIVISQGEKKLKKDLGKLNYYHIRSSDFYREILAKIKNFTNIHFIQDSVQTIESSPNNSVTVSTKNHGSFYAEMVFNSVPDSSTNLRHHKILKQVFLGWKVKTKKACFEVDTAIMMDFDQKKTSKTAFFYVLPFKENEALIEYTEFTTDQMDRSFMESKINHFIRNQLGQDRYEITFREEGSIPMTTYSLTEAPAFNIIPIGTLAGCSKPSTGFTFHNIQKHCQLIVNSLATAEGKALIWKRKWQYNFYDNILLNIAKKWPKKLPEVFINLFESNTGPDILRFLNEESSFLDDIKLLSRLQFSIFIKSLLHYEKH